MSLKRILVAEDNEDNRRILLYRLKKIAEFEIVEAANGEEAVTAVETQSPDLIFMDLKMPAEAEAPNPKSNALPAIILNDSGFRPLHLATIASNKGLVSFLLDNGAHDGHKTKKGFRARDIAKIIRVPEILEVFREHAAHKDSGGGMFGA